MLQPFSELLFLEMPISLTIYGGEFEKSNYENCAMKVTRKSGESEVKIKCVSRLEKLIDFKIRKLTELELDIENVSVSSN